MSDVTISPAQERVPAGRAWWSEPAVVLLALSVVLTAALLPFDPSKAFGLPAHPLLVHIPVVLVPVLAVAAIALSLRPVWRDRWGVPTAILGLAALAGTVLAAGAGEALRDSRMRGMSGGRFPGGGAPGRPGQAGAGAGQGPGQMPQLPSGGGQGGAVPKGGGGASGLSEHASLGSTLRWFVIGLVVVFAVVLLLDRLRARGAAGVLALPAVTWAVSAIVVVLAILSFVWVIRTGHAGAKLTWGQEG